MIGETFRSVEGTVLNKWTIGGALILTGAIFIGFASERSWMTSSWSWTGPLKWTWGKTIGLVPLLFGVAVLTRYDPLSIETRSRRDLELPQF